MLDGKFSAELALPRRAAHRRRSLRRTVADGLARAVECLLVWQERAQQRRHLLMLDDRLLRDIGLTRADVEREAAQPFWRL